MTDMIQIVSGSGNSPSVQYVTVSQPTTVSLQSRHRTQTHSDKISRGRSAPDQEIVKNRPSILRAVTKAEDSAIKTQMEGDAKLELPDHPAYVMLDVSSLHCESLYSDIRILCSDGQVFAHSLVLCGMSPFLKRLMKEAWSQGGVPDWVRDEYPVISLPEITVEEITLLLALLYTGSVNLYKSELSKLVALTHQLKLVSIPVAVVEESWDQRFTPSSTPEIEARASISFIPPLTSRRGRPSKPSSSQLLTSSSQQLPSTSQPLSSSSQQFPSSSQLSSSNQLLASSHLVSSSQLRSSLNPNELQQELQLPLTLHVPHTLSIERVDAYKGSAATLLEKRDMDVAKARQAGVTTAIRNVIGKQLSDQTQQGNIQITLKERGSGNLEHKNEVKTAAASVVFENKEVPIETIEAVEDGKHDLEVQEFQMFVNEGEEVDGEGTTLIEISEEGRVERMEVVQGDIEGNQQMELIDGQEGMVVEIDEGRVEYLERTGGGKRGRPRKASGEKRRSKSETEEVDLDAKVYDYTDETEVGNVTLVQTEDGEGEMAVVQAEDADGLDSLISVAEAFERSRQPDFNDIASPIVDGTDTEKQLVRNCLLCNKSMLGRNALGRHMKNVHPKVFGPYRCPVPECPKLLDSGAKLMTHMYSHTGGRAKALANDCPRYQCSQCDVIYTTTSRLNEHLRKKHNITEGYQEQKFACNAGDADCTLMFPTARKFIQHMKIAHKLKPWLCDHCNKRFMERQNYQYHLMSHEGRKNFACDICNKSFANPRQLYCHRALHLGKRFLCQDCGYRARSSANLRGHIKAKHEGKQYTCGLCTKKFSSANNLKNHVRIHTGETPYECELCGVKFKRMHHLHSHIESKIHIDIMEKCRRKGYSIPERLDPLRRARGRPTVLDGPVTLVAADEFETHITEIDGDDIDALHGDIIQVEGEEAWKTYSMGTEGRGQDEHMGQVVVVEEQALQGDLEAYVIPVSGDTVEIVQAGTMAQDGTVTLQGVTMLPGGGEEAVTLTEQEAIAFTSGGQIFVNEGGMEGMDAEDGGNFATTSERDQAETEHELSC